MKKFKDLNEELNEAALTKRTLKFYPDKLTKQLSELKKGIQKEMDFTDDETNLEVFKTLDQIESKIQSAIMASKKLEKIYVDPYK